MNKKRDYGIRPVTDWSNEEGKTLPVIKVCPELGLREDRETITAFASEDNYCYQKIKPTHVEPGHQVEYCLTINFPQCPIYRQARQEEPLPKTGPWRTRLIYGLVAILSIGLLTGIVLVFIR